MRNLFLIKILVFTTLLSCRSIRPSSDTLALHRDQNSRETGLVDTGIYIDARATTTKGEIYSEEFASKRWSGDVMIHRDENGYTPLMHERYSPRGNFFFKAKLLKPDVLTSAPDSIDVIKGSLVVLAEGCSNTSGASVDPNAGSTFKTLISGSDPQQGGSSAGQVAVLWRGKRVQAGSYTLCESTDQVIRANSPHKQGMKLYSLALKPDANGQISVVLNWKRKNSELARFVVEVKNLRERTTEYEVIATNTVEETFLVPDYQDCNAVAICNGYRNREPKMREICESMNKMIDPIYSYRMQGIVKPWEQQKAQLDQIASTCVVSVFSGPRKRGVSQPTVFKHSSHGLRAFLSNSAVEEDYADLRFVKALVKSMKSLKSKFAISGFGYSGIYNYRKMNTSNGSNRLSRHANGMAIDVHYFIDSSGKKIPVTSYRKNPLLKKIKNHFCQYFKVVLGPEYNKLHYNHFHLDLSASVQTDYDFQPPRFQDISQQSGNFSLLGEATQVEALSLTARGPMNTTCR